MCLECLDVMEIFIHANSDRVTRHREVAFSLVETLVSVAIMGIMITALAMTFAQSYTVTQSSRELLRATQIITEKMEVVRLLTWDQLGTIPQSFSAPYDYKNTNSDGLTFYGTINFADPPHETSYKSEMKMVTVKVTWDTGHGWHSESLSSLCAKNGLQRYVFQH
jgi:type II secretory pathway pseudopilin PulG